MAEDYMVQEPTAALLETEYDPQQIRRALNLTLDRLSADKDSAHAYLTSFPENAEAEQFTAIFRFARDYCRRLLNMDDTQIADALKVSRPTISRWANGKSFPHGLMRKLVIDKMAELIAGDGSRSKKRYWGRPRSDRPKRRV